LEEIEEELDRGGKKGRASEQRCSIGKSSTEYARPVKETRCNRYWQLFMGELAVRYRLPA